MAVRLEKLNFIVRTKLCVAKGDPIEPTGQLADPGGP